MKYLKLFNESNDPFGNELREFCNNNLAYLIDIGYTIECVNYNSEIIIEIEYSEYFSWGDIKYDFIPFLILLNDKYNIDQIEVKTRYAHKYELYKIDTILKDNFSLKNIDKIIMGVNSHLYVNPLI